MCVTTCRCASVCFSVFHFWATLNGVVVGSHFGCFIFFFLFSYILFSLFAYPGGDERRTSIARRRGVFVEKLTLKPLPFPHCCAVSAQCVFNATAAFVI